MGTAIHYCRVSGKRISAEDFFRGDAVEWKGYTYSKDHVPKEAREAQQRGTSLLPGDLVDQNTDGSALTRRLSDSGKLPRRGTGAVSGRAASPTSARRVAPASGRSMTPSARQRAGTSSRRRQTTKIVLDAKPAESDDEVTSATPVPSLQRGRSAMLKMMIAVIAVGLGLTVTIIALSGNPSDRGGDGSSSAGGDANGQEELDEAVVEWLDDLGRLGSDFERFENVSADQVPSHLAADAQHSFDRGIQLQQTAETLGASHEIPAEATQRLESYLATFAEFALEPRLDAVREACWEKIVAADQAGLGTLLGRIGEGRRPDLLPEPFLAYESTQKRLAEVATEMQEIARSLSSLSPHQREVTQQLLSLRSRTEEVAAARRPPSWSRLDPLYDELAPLYDELGLGEGNAPPFLVETYATVVEPLSRATRARLAADLEGARNWANPRGDSIRWFSHAERAARHVPNQSTEASQLLSLAKQAELPLYRRAHDIAADLTDFSRGHRHLADLLALREEHAPTLFAEFDAQPEAFGPYHRAVTALVDGLSMFLLDTAGEFETFSEDIANWLYERCQRLLALMSEQDAQWRELNQLHTRLVIKRPAPRELGMYGRNARSGLAADAGWRERIYGFGSITLFLIRFDFKDSELHELARTYQHMTLDASIQRLREIKDAGFDSDSDRVAWRAGVEFLRSYLDGFGGFPEASRVLDEFVEGKAEPCLEVANTLAGVYVQLGGQATLGRPPTRKLWYVAFRIGEITKPLANGDLESDAGKQFAAALHACVHTFRGYGQNVGSKQHAEILIAWADLILDNLMVDWSPQFEQWREQLEGGKRVLTEAIDQLSPAMNPLERD